MPVEQLSKLMEFFEIRDHQKQTAEKYVHWDNNEALSQLADQIAGQGNQPRNDIYLADGEVQLGEPALMENPYQDIFGDINKFTKA